MDYSTPKSSKKPVVSIVMPAYNSSATIEDSIESVLHQTFTDWELLIIDDCSEENIEKKVRGFQDKRIHYYRLAENHGVAHARNVAIKKVMICGFRKNWNARFSLWRRIIIRLPILGIDSLKKVHKSRGG